MALEPCRECGQEVSTEAKTCPQCGTPNPTAGRTEVGSGRGCLWALAVIAAFIVFGSLLDRNPDTTNSDSSEPTFVDLPARVSFDGTQFTIRNEGSFPWTNCELSINAGIIRGGWDLDADRLAAGNTYTVGAMQFTKDGERFNPVTHKPETFRIYCDTPRGDGAYSGGWD